MKFMTLALTTVMLLPLMGAAAEAKDATDGKSEELAVEKMICQQLYVHKPSDDVAYKPGVDVDGNAVTPADLPTDAAQIGVSDYIEVPLTVDLAQRLNQPVPEGVKLEGGVGNLRLHKNGQISYNGQDILPQASAMCGEELEVEETTSTVEIGPPSGQADFEDPPVAGSVVPSMTDNPPPPPPHGKKTKLVKKTAHFTGSPAQ
jgi:hypothetical protein